MAVLWLELGQKGKKNLCGRALVRMRAKIEKITLFGRTLVRISARIEKTPFLVGLWLEKGQK